MEKRYIVSGYGGVDDIVSTLENSYNIFHAPEDAEYPGAVFEVTIKEIGTIRHRFEVELDSPQS